jgi:hypothetical protein
MVTRSVSEGLDKLLPRERFLMLRTCFLMLRTLSPEGTAVNSPGRKPLSLPTV